MTEEEHPIQQIGIQSNNGGDITIEQSQVHIAGRDLHIYYSQSNSSRHSGPVFFLPTNLPGWYVERTEAVNALKLALLGSQRTVGVVAAAAVHGLGGLGKTVLARAICEDQTIRSTFTGGILWATLGQSADCRRHQREWIEALGGDATKANSLEAGKVELSRLLTDKESFGYFDKAFLLILDDVWDARDTEPLMFGNEQSRVLITTRDAAQVEGTVLISLELMSQSESHKLLREASRGTLTDTEQIEAIAKRLGYLPLALQVVGSLLGRGISFQDIDSALQEGDLRFLSTSQRDIFSAIATSVHFLSEDKQERYRELAIFARNEPLITAVVARFWQQTAKYKERDTHKLLAELRDMSLVQLDNTLHDLQCDYLIATTHQKQLQQWHSSLVEAYREIPLDTLGSDERNYIVRYLIAHTVQAERVFDLELILTNANYLQRKIALVGTSGLLADFAVAPKNPLLERLANTIRFSASFLDNKPEELLNQIQGRTGLSSKLHDIPTFTKPHFRLDSQTLAPSGGSLLRIFDHKEHVYGCAFSPDGQLALSASGHDICLWDVQTGSSLHHHAHGHNVAGCVFSPNGQQFLSCSMDRTLKLWNIHTKRNLSSTKKQVEIDLKCLYTFTGHEDGVLGCAFSPNGLFVLSASMDHTLRLWDVQTGGNLHVFREHQDRVCDCTFSPDGRYALSASNDQTMRLWNVQTRQCLRVFEDFANAVIRCAFSPDGHMLLSCSWSSLQLWDVPTGQLVRSFKGHGGWIRGCAFSRDGGQIFSTADDGTLRVWDVQTGQCLYVFEGHSDKIFDCALSADGRFALSASLDHTLRLWNIHIKQATFKSKEHTSGIFGCAFSSTGQQVVSASLDHTLRLWDVQSQQVIQLFHGHTDGIQGCAFSLDDRWILSSSIDHTLRLWDARTGQLVHIFEEHPDGVPYCAFSPDGLFVLSACDDGILRLWDVQTKQLIRTFEGHTGSVTSCVFSHDGRHIFSCSFDGTIRFWDVSTGQSRELGNALLGNTPLRYEIWSCALSPGGQLVAKTNNLVRYRHPDSSYIGNHYYNLRLLNIETGEVLTLAGSWDEEMEHEGKIWSCTFSPDGRFILSASDDYKLRLWDIRGNELTHWTAEAALYCCAFSSDGARVVAGDKLGNLHFLSLLNQ